MGCLARASVLGCLMLAKSAVAKSALFETGFNASTSKDASATMKESENSSQAQLKLGAAQSSDVQHADLLALLFSLLGGFFMGAYPVPIKSPSVLKVDPHPVIFQCYKTFWVFATGWLFVLARWIQGSVPIFEFTWWGTISAAGWIPSGLCTIAAVPRLGVGMAIAVSTGAASILSFLVFWLVLGESMKLHNIDGHFMYLAPIYLLFILAGMVGLVMAPGSSNARPAGSTAAAIGETRRASVGLVCALLAGVFSAVQYGAVNLGKKAAQRAAGCAGDSSKCTAAFNEEFNNFGSWMASFGFGALLMTTVPLAGVCLEAKAQGQALPKFHFRTLWAPGCAAGLLWVLGNFFQTAAVVRGGNAVMLPANMAIQLVTSGAFGLVYYREVPEPRRAALWTCAAAWTLACIILLSREKS